jgi:hypothetical protein
MIQQNFQKESHRETAGLEVQRKKEYRLLGRYIRTRGLELFSFNPETGEVQIAETVSDGTIHLELVEGRYRGVNKSEEKAMIDPRMIYFEALNMGTAQKRVDRYRQGKITELSNLRVAGSGIISFDFQRDGMKKF